MSGHHPSLATTVPPPFTHHPSPLSHYPSPTTPLTNPLPPLSIGRSRTCHISSLQGHQVPGWEGPRWRSYSRCPLLLVWRTVAEGTDYAFSRGECWQGALTEVVMGVYQGYYTRCNGGLIRFVNRAWEWLWWGFDRCCDVGLTGVVTGRKSSGHWV